MVMNFMIPLSIAATVPGLTEPVPSVTIIAIFTEDFIVISANSDNIFTPPSPGFTFLIIDSANSGVPFIIMPGPPGYAATLRPLSAYSLIPEAEEIHWNGLPMIPL